MVILFFFFGQEVVEPFWAFGYVDSAPVFLYGGHQAGLYQAVEDVVEHGAGEGGTGLEFLHGAFGVAEHGGVQLGLVFTETEFFEGYGGAIFLA